MLSDEECDSPTDRISWTSEKPDFVCDAASSETEQSNSGYRNEFTLYVSGLPVDTSENDLQNMFGLFGSVCDTVVISKRDDDVNQLRPKYGFVTFNKEEDAKMAISTLNQTLYEDHLLTVAWSKNNGRKKHDHRRSQQGDPSEDDDGSDLNTFIEVYTGLKIAHSNDLPDLGQLLRDIKQMPNKLVGPYEENECKISIDLKSMHL